MENTLPISDNNPPELVEDLRTLYNMATFLYLENGIMHYICDVWFGTTVYTVRFEVPMEHSDKIRLSYKMDARELLQFRTN